MIQIDMPMPTNCLDCPACNEYLNCAIPVNGRKWGENDVREFGQCRPGWCPLKEHGAVEPKVEKAILDYQSLHYICGDCGGQIDIHDNYCRHCGRVVAHISNKI